MRCIDTTERGSDLCGVVRSLNRTLIISTDIYIPKPMQPSRSIHPRLQKLGPQLRPSLTPANYK